MRENRGVYHYLAVSVVMLLLFFTGSALASSQDLSLKLKSGNYIQKADNVYIIVDKSGSMLDEYAGEEKFEIEENLVSNFNRTIPDLSLKAAVENFGNNFSDFRVTILNYGIEKYDVEAVDKAIKQLCCPFGDSNLGVAITLAGTGLSRVQGKSAIVIFSDGEDMTDYPIKSAQIVKRILGDNVCIYTVQIGNDKNGAKLLDKVAQAGQCGVAVNGDKLAGDAAMTDFVEKIFLAEKPLAPPPPPPPVKEPEVVALPAPVPAPVPPPPVEEIKKAPEAAVEIEQKMVETGRVTLKVEFDTNKSVVKSKYYKEIQNVADFMKKNPDKKIIVEGHTDSIGSAKANLTLSQRRADAVKNVLVSKFKIKSSRIEAKGYGGAKPIASNASAEGRQLNRRVEAVVE